MAVKRKSKSTGHETERQQKDATVKGSIDELAKKYWHLQEDARIQGKILEVSSHILRHSGSATYLEDALTAIVEICQEALDCDISVIELFDPVSNELVGVAEFGKPYNPDGYFRLPLDEAALSTLAFKESRTIAITDVTHDTRVSQRVRQHLNAKSAIASPLIVDNKPIGLLLTMTTIKTRHFSQRDIALMDGLASQAALAVNSQMERKNRMLAENRFQRLVEFAPMSILILDKDGNILQTNHTSEELICIPGHRLIGKPFFNLFQNSKTILSYFDELELDNDINFETCLIRDDGKEVHVGVSANLVSIEGSIVIQAFIRNITTRKMAELSLTEEKEHAQKLAKKMSYMASHDALTGLVNRNEFEIRLKDLIDNTRRQDTTHAICFIDLDHFKAVNDTGGHAAGDELLRQLTRILVKTTRQSDTLARLGGDEFGLLLEGCSLDKAKEIAEGVRSTVKRFKLVWDNNIFGVGASIGVASITSASSDIKEVLRAVDSACFLAKERGRNRVCVYEPDSTQISNRSGDALWNQRIKDALEHNHFRLFYQRIEGMPSDTGKVDWVEILLRLRHNNSDVSPAVFFPAAERYHMMPDIDRWVIEAVFKFIYNAAENHLIKQSRVNINISGQSLNDTELYEFIKQNLSRYQISADQICFEITETAAVANFTHAVKFCTQLKKLGCRLALDDFGADMSSLLYLKEFPIDYLKIDGYLIKNLANSEIDREIVIAINRIGHAMGLQTIAEYVADEVIQKTLLELGINYMQGYQIHMPSELK